MQHQGQIGQVNRQDVAVAGLVGKFLDQCLADRSRMTDRRECLFELSLLELKITQALVILGQVEPDLDVVRGLGG